MAYTKQEWIDNETLINAEKLNHIEDGIEAAGGEAPIEKITVNNVEQPIEDKTVNIDIPITGINVNGDPAEVEDHIAKLTVAAEAPIEHISVNNVEQAIVDKTVNLDIDRAEVDEEEKTLIVGDITGGGTIECIKVNGTALAIENSTVDISVPTKTSELDNDAGYVDFSALSGYAKETDIPTKVSELDNDSGYITNDALDGYALEDQLPTKVSELTNDSKYITATLDGETLRLA